MYFFLHVSGDTWHVTHDKWHMKYSVGWTFSQNFSSLAFSVGDWQSFEGIWNKGWIYELIKGNRTIADLGYSLEQAQVVGIVGIVGMVGMVGMVGIVGINK